MSTYRLQDYVERMRPHPNIWSTDQDNPMTLAPGDVIECKPHMKKIKRVFISVQGSPEALMNYTVSDTQITLGSSLSAGGELCDVFIYGE